jgi:uncharacterized protein YcfJ
MCITLNFQTGASAGLVHRKLRRLKVQSGTVLCINIKEGFIMTYFKSAALIFVSIIGLSACSGGGAGIVPDMKTITSAFGGGDDKDKKEQSDDSQNTKLQGAAVGAVLGGLIGYLSGEDAKSALIGTAVGAGAGYVVGNEVAKRKKAYKNKEEMIAKESERTAKLVKEVRSINSGLRKDIKNYQKEARILQTKVAKGQAKKSHLRLQKKAVEKRYGEAKKALNAVDKELQVSEQLYADAKSEKKATGALKKWERRIAQLKKEKIALQRNSGQLQAVSKTLG